MLFFFCWCKCAKEDDGFIIFKLRGGRFRSDSICGSPAVPGVDCGRSANAGVNGIELEAALSP